MDQSFIDNQGILMISKSIQNCNSLLELSTLYSSFQEFQRSLIPKVLNPKDYDHPTFYYDFGVCLLIEGKKNKPEDEFLKNTYKDIARDAFLKGAAYGLKYRCKFYDSFWINSIGQCFTYLVTDFNIKDNSLGVKITALAYVYLSRCIEIDPINSYDSYYARAGLFIKHRNPKLIGFDNFQPYIISDYYYASDVADSPFKSKLEVAKMMHSNMEDQLIGGRRAYQYSFSEMVKLGHNAHAALYRELNNNYRAGDYDMTEEELVSVVF